MIVENNQVLILTYQKGYRITNDGKLLNSKGKELVGGDKPVGKSIYKHFTTRFQKKFVVITFHRLQAYQKFGDKIFEEGIVVRHLDGNSLNNSWDNIAIGTSSDNQMDIPKEIRTRSAIKASRKMQNNNRSFNERCKIYEHLKNGIPYSEIMLKYNISSKGTLSFMKNKSIEYKQYLNSLIVQG